MKLKLDDKGAAVIQDGKPVYVHDDGKEVAFDAPATVQTIGRLNGEAKGHRERAEAAEGKLKAFDGLDDPVRAREALKTIANLDAKKLVDAGQLETLKADLLKSAEQSKVEAIKAVEDKYAPIVAKAETLEKQLHAEKIGGGFARSKFVAEKLILPADIVEARFGHHFKIEDGKVVAFDRDGNKIYSKSRPGETAMMDEALETIIEQYPSKEHILKGPGSSGGGAGGDRGGQPSGKQMKRAAWEQLPAAQKSAHFANGGTLID